MTIRKQVFSGVKWTTISTIVLAATAILKISILTRFLDKSDFGLMALVTFVIGFMDLFNNMGLTSAILHKQEISKKEYASLYWFNLLVGIGMYGILITITPFIVNFYNQEELKLLIPLIGLNLVISGIGRQFKIVEQKELQFKGISIVDISTSILSLIVAVFLAVNGYGVYSLVISSVIQSFSSSIIFLIIGLKKQGLLFHYQFSDTKPFLKIGSYQVGGQLVNYFNRDLDVLLIGKFFGTDLLGGYSLAKQLVRRPLQIINPITDKVGISVFPKYQNDVISLKRYFLIFLKAYGPINSFVYGFIAISAPYLVELFYGDNYSSIVPYVQLFACLIFLRSMSGISGIIVITKGRTDYDFYWNIITTIIMPISIFIGAMYSVELIIVLMTIIQFLFLVPSWYIFYKRLLNIEFVSFMKPHFFPLIIGITVFLLNKLFFNISKINTIGGSLFLLLLIGVYTYFTLKEFRNYLITIYSKYARI
ncbi:MOP flippase family protein [Cyclobacterium amurskyense]|uniref:Lipopolysaccharide biosynthesis protein WzxC n=1 Tax=Cyclobacterium amurskyense TaxID=320787 RepID=A0A0H4PHU1_9BACT|nr:MOP flippase family protein [Cyclobacterium amurskyense]AKP52433.1 hypothetical protein CA2015_3031 [Cyclobacterium amurskyense]